jgi:hypothetical protein
MVDTIRLAYSLLELAIAACGAAGRIFGIGERARATRRAVAVRDRSAIHVDVGPGRARGMVDTVGLAGLILELAGTARRARGCVIRVRDAAGTARRATAVRDESPIRVDASPGGARGMIDAIGLAGFVLELAVTALQAIQRVGLSRETPGFAQSASIWSGE